MSALSTTTNSAAVNPFEAINGTSTTTGTGKSQEAGSQDRFLTLLVTQLQNQDPLNPMDNAAVTSQMAQISTVTGLDKLNTAIAGLSTQFTQMQALQGVGLVGRDVTVAGDRLTPNADGSAMRAGFELASAADKVQIEVLGAAGQVVDTLQLGAQGAGRHSFDWTSKGGTSGERFRVTASSGSTQLETTALMQDRVTAVSSNGTSLQLELQRGSSVAYGDVKSFN